MCLDNLVLEAKKIVTAYAQKAVQAGQGQSLGRWLQHYPEQGTNACPIESRQFQIGHVRIANPLVSAPLAGISDHTFRIFAKFFGCGLTFSEMVTGCGLYYGHSKSMALAQVTELERPCAVQIFGAKPEIMAQAAAKIEGIADIIDINMGCPVPKILKNQSGGWLHRDPKNAEAMVKAVVEKVRVPVTVKMRLGWDFKSINVVDMALAAEAQGAKAISIHGRTVRQGFSGSADYRYIKKTKEKVGIPVIVSGDIGSPIKARDVLEYTGCDAVMIGRSAKGSMWVLMNILLIFLGQETHYMPDLEWKIAFSSCYLKFMIFFKGEQKAIKEFRKYLSWIFKGEKGVSRARKNFFAIESFDDAVTAMCSLKDGM